MELDDLDLKILAELENNARQTVQETARKLGMNRTTIGYRLNRLISRDVLRFACIANVESLNVQIPLGIGINTAPGKVDSVAAQLAALAAVKVVNLVAGRYGVFAWVLLKDRRNMAHFFSEELGKIPDIVSTEVLYAFNWVREAWNYFNPPQKTVSENYEYQPDELDKAIIQSLQKDPRQTILELSHSSGCCKSVAKTRMENLISRKIIQIVSIVDSAALGYEIEAMILVKSTPDQVHAVANELSRQSTARHVSLTAGNWQIFISAQFRDNKHMQEELSKNLAAVPGVIDFEIIHILKILKFSTDFIEMM